MAQTRMFRDRVVSMEQTLEGGEKNLDFLKGLCLDAFPEFAYREHALDHERDLFVMRLEAEDGRRKTVAWTRMVLFDAERLPALVENPISPLRSRILAFLQARAARTEIVVTFRHLEDGWVDTPEPRREKRRGRRGGREGRGGRASSQGRAPAAPGQPGPSGPRRDGAQKGSRPGRPDRGPAPVGPLPREARPGSVPKTSAPPQSDAAPGAPGEAAAGEGRGGRRRRFRRRRRGRGGAGTGSSPQGGPPPPEPKA